ncbi:MAG: hypothetical protein Q4F79_07365 [Eubacteriales bacterium]|nr:hypothetical protein [Eubacteriales bacterium]
MKDNIDRLLDIINATTYPQHTLKWMIYLLENHPSIAKEIAGNELTSPHGKGGAA